MRPVLHNQKLRDFQNNRNLQSALLCVGQSDFFFIKTVLRDLASKPQKFASCAVACLSKANCLFCNQNIVTIFKSE